MALAIHPLGDILQSCWHSQSTRAQGPEPFTPMSKPWEKLRCVLCCPEDSEPLEFCGAEYRCAACARRFPIQFGCIADLRPRSPQTIECATNPQFARDYEVAFHRPLQGRNEALAWGAKEAVPLGWARKRERQVRHVQRMLEEEGSTVHTFCDFSAGAGYYTLALAPFFPVVLHCDLSCDSLLYASQKAEKMGIRNVAFLRIDYLRPPFVGKLDCAICMDSLERGEDHERRLLTAILRSLKPGGIGVVDFHNWWHNPARRLGLLPQNFGLNRSYTRREAEGLLRSCGVGEFRYLPFYQEFEPDGVASRMAQVVLPPTRHLFLFKERRGDSSL